VRGSGGRRGVYSPPCIRGMKKKTREDHRAEKILPQKQFSNAQNQKNSKKIGLPDISISSHQLLHHFIHISISRGQCTYRVPVDKSISILSQNQMLLRIFENFEYISSCRRTRNRTTKSEKASDKMSRSYSESRAKQSSAGTAGSAASDQATRN
jgi:hypothetical protein